MRWTGLAIGLGMLLTVGCDSSLSPEIARSGAGGTGGATHLVFSVQPTSAVATEAISPPIQVNADDAAGITDTSYSGFVTLTIGTNPASGALAGTVSVSAIAGVATFTDISIDSAGTGYTLVATSGSLTQRISSAFNITP